MKNKVVKLTYILDADKSKAILMETPYNITKETEKMYFLETDDGFKTKQNKTVIGNIKVAHESSTCVELIVWCMSKDLAKMKRLLKIQMKDLVTNWHKSTKSMLDILK